MKTMLKFTVMAGLVLGITSCTTRYPSGSVVYRTPDGNVYRQGQVYRDRNGNVYQNGAVIRTTAVIGLPGIIDVNGNIITSSGKARGKSSAPGQMKKRYGGSAKNYAPGQQKKW